MAFGGCCLSQANGVVVRVAGPLRYARGAGLAIAAQEYPPSPFWSDIVVLPQNHVLAVGSKEWLVAVPQGYP